MTWLTLLKRLRCPPANRAQAASRSLLHFAQQDFQPLAQRTALLLIRRSAPARKSAVPAVGQMWGQGESRMRQVSSSNPYNRTVEVHAGGQLDEAPRPNSVKNKSRIRRNLRPCAESKRRIGTLEFRKSRQSLPMGRQELFGRIDKQTKKMGFVGALLFVA